MYRGFQLHRRFAATVLAICAVAVCISSNVLPVLADEGNAATIHTPDTRSGTLTLINGNHTSGHLVDGLADQIIRWHADGFAEPTSFAIGAIASIKFSTDADSDSSHDRTEEPTAGGLPGTFQFELRGGDVLSGDLADWSDEAITIRSAAFESIQIKTSALLRMYRTKQNPALVFARMSGLRDWKNTSWDTSDWSEDGDALQTTTSGAVLNADFQIPDRAVVEFELSWSRAPDFVFAIGVDASASQDEDSDGWRLETVDQKLAVLRQTSDAADVAQVAELTPVQRIRLTVYLDQRKQTMHVVGADGTILAHVRLPDTLSDPAQTDPADDDSARSEFGRGLRLINRGDDLRLERLRIARWLGEIPKRGDPDQAQIALADGGFITGRIQRWDDQGQSFVIGDDAAGVDVPLADVIAMKRNTPADDGPQPQCAIFLHGAMRISGDLDGIDDQSWVLQGHDLARPIRIARSAVRSMIVFRQDSIRDHESNPGGRLGRLQTDQNELTGWLVPATGDESDPFASLVWRPFGSTNPARLDSNASGRVLYRETPKADPSSSATRALALQRLRLQQQKRGLNFGQLFLQRVDMDRRGRQPTDKHVLHLRAGDVFECTVHRIDADGVYVSRVGAGDAMVPHTHVKAIEWSSSATPPDLQEAKRQRLLTIPRLQKTAPPTHLICSHSGDFLRCRVLGADEQIVRVEVQLEQIDIPRDRIAQMIWFHESEWRPETPENASNRDQASYRGQVQALRRDGKRMTFMPIEVTSTQLHGRHVFLGPVQVEINQCDQIVLGRQIPNEVVDVAYNQWRLQPAQEPLVTQAMEGGQQVGQLSPLIDQPAPSLQLPLLGGGRFRLSDQKGRVVVLDFWASWCAPCMQTMPLLIQSMEEFDPQQVDLISVNIQETDDQIATALERHSLSAHVAMDVDGIAAQQFRADAIPQIVIVDQEGTVRYVFVGGGQQVVDAVVEAVQDLISPDASES